MKNALNNQVSMFGDMFLWLAANLKQGGIYFIKQACGNEIMPSVYRVKLIHSFISETTILYQIVSPLAQNPGFNACQEGSNFYCSFSYQKIVCNYYVEFENEKKLGKMNILRQSFELRILNKNRFTMKIF